MSCKGNHKARKLISGGLAAVLLAGAVAFLASVVIAGSHILKAKLQNKGI